MTIPIFLLPGMTREYPVYQKLLPLLRHLDVRVAKFLEHRDGDTLATYAQQMSARFPANCCIGGVSFGGIVALEISRVLRPRACILISTVKSPRELPPYFRFLSWAGQHNCERTLRRLGYIASNVPTRVRTGTTSRLTKLAGNEGEWHRWATAAVAGWRSCNSSSVPTIHIHGDRDTTFPLRYVTPDVVISSGQHALPVSHPVETAKAISDFVAGL